MTHARARLLARRNASVAVAAAIGLSSASGAGFAAAEKAAHDGKLSAELLAGYGVNEKYGLGLGTRAGYAFSNRLYVGAAYVYHFGVTNPTLYGDAVYRVWLAGGEGGYEIPMGNFIVRPFVGVGLGEYVSTRCAPLISGGGDCAETTNRSFALWPGVSLLLPIGVAVVGVDVRFDIVTGETYVVTPAIFASAGFRF